MAHLAKLNKSQLADFLGYSERALTDWQAEGMPIERAGARGQEHVYDSAAVVAWLLEREAQRIRGQSPRDDYLRSQTRLNEMKIAEQEGRLVDAAEVEAGFVRMVVSARQRLLQIPTTSADALGSMDSAARREFIDKEIREALVELSRYDPDPGAPAA